MIRLSRALLPVGICAMLVPGVAAAQSSGWDGRVRASVNGGVQAGNDTLAQSFSVPKNLEATPITVDIDARRGQLFDAGIVVRLKGAFGVGVAVSYLTHDSSANVTAQVPHPFFFNQPRTVTGTTPVSRTEIVGHLDAVYIVPGRKLDLLLSGGPSVFSLEQTLATDITYGDTYPYDTASFLSATTTRATKTATGYHLGADVTWKLSRNFGLGGMIRYARASATLSAGSDNTVKDNAGGLQAGGGIRIAF